MSASSRLKVEEFFSHYKKRIYKKGELVLIADQEVTEIFYIKTGQVRQYIISPLGEETSLTTFREGSYIPLTILLSDKKNRYYFESEEESILFMAPYDKVIEFIKNDEEALFDLVKRLSMGLSGLLEKIELLLQFSSHQKVAKFLLYASHKYGKDIDDGKLIEVDFSHSEIASWLGLQRETVSRQIEKFEKDKILINRNHKILINQKKLESIVNSD